MHTNIDATLQTPNLAECATATVEAAHQPSTIPNESTGEDKDSNLIDQVGQLTRALHDSLRELGYDKRLESITSEVPVAQDKLTYVATKIEQAAECALNATETAMPIQDKLASNATQLAEKWKGALESRPATSPDFTELLIDTLSYLDDVPKQTSATNAQLMDIMMAQDFQDLTGQVIKKITQMIQTLERELVQLLLENRPVSKTEQKMPSEEGLLNGPVTNPEKRTDVVSNQDQVDELLASLGF